MKKIFYFVMKFMLAIVAGMMMLVGAVALDWSDRACFALYFFGTLFIALVLGVFDMPASRRRVRHKSLSEGYRDAA